MVGQPDEQKGRSATLPRSPLFDFGLMVETVKQQQEEKTERLTVIEVYVNMLTIKDIQALKSLLTDSNLCGYIENNIRLLYNEIATKEKSSKI